MPTSSATNRWKVLGEVTMRTFYSGNARRERGSPRRRLFAVHLLGRMFAHGPPRQLARNQSRAATERHVLNSPLDQHLNPALEFHNVQQMDKGPHKPRDKSRNVKTKNVSHRRPAANHRHVSLVEIPERRHRAARQAGLDELAGVVSSLNGNLRHAGELVPALIKPKRQVS